MRVSKVLFLWLFARQVLVVPDWGNSGLLYSIHINPQCSFNFIFKVTHNIIINIPQNRKFHGSAQIRDPLSLGGVWGLGTLGCVGSQWDQGKHGPLRDLGETPVRMRTSKFRELREILPGEPDAKLLGFLNGQIINYWKFTAVSKRNLAPAKNFNSLHFCGLYLFHNIPGRAILFRHEIAQH